MTGVPDFSTCTQPRRPGSLQYSNTCTHGFRVLEILTLQYWPTYTVYKINKVDPIMFTSNIQSWPWPARQEYRPAASYVPLIFTLITCCIYLFSFLIYYRNFSIVYTDPDQLVVAEAAKIYASLRLPEPFFFGQNYLLLIESMLSAPLVALGIRADMATLFVAGLLFYTPFIMAVYFVSKYRHPRTAAWFLVFPLLLDPKYNLVALMPRGFIGSVGTGAIALMIFVVSSNRKWQFLCTLILGIAAAAYTPSIMYAPLLLLNSRRADTLRYIFFFLIGFGLVKIGNVFYAMHPEYLVASAWPLQFSVHRFFTSLNLSTISPLLLSAPVTGTLLVYSLSLRNTRIEQIKLWRLIGAISGVAIVCLLALSSPKIDDAGDSVYFSGIRFFLPLPFCILAALAWLALQSPKSAEDTNKAPQYRSTWLAVGVLAALLLLNTRIWINSHGTEEFARQSAVRPAIREQVVQSCERIKAHLTGNFTFGKIEGRNDLLAYGCTVFSSITLFQSDFERRHWLVREIANQQGRILSVPPSGL